MTHAITTDWAGPKVAILTFSDLERANQICWAAIDELAGQLRYCRESGARVLILASGLEGHWLQHAWLQDLLNGIDGLEQTGSGAGWFTALNELCHEGVISIAAISGDCSGGGAELGWACDLRIAEQQSQFAQPEINMGLTTGIGGSSRLAQLAGRATAAEMVLTGKPMSAQRLCDLGAVNSVVQTGQAVAASLELAMTLAEKSPTAVAGLKRILAASDDSTLTEAMGYEQEVFQSVIATTQAREGMQNRQSAYDSGAGLASISDKDD